MEKELKEEIYHTIIEHPSYSDYQIAKQLNVSRALVWKTRGKLAQSIDYELAKKVAGKFLNDFQMASDYWRLQIDRLEELKKKTKTIQRNNVSTHQIETKEVPLDPIDILAIEKQQSDLWAKIVFMARQGEAIEVMRVMNNGRAKAITDTGQ